MQQRKTMDARLLVRGLTQREIQSALAQPDGIRNGSGRPWSVATVNRDVRAIKLAWQCHRIAIAELGLRHIRIDTRR